MVGSKYILCPIPLIFIFKGFLIGNMPFFPKGRVKKNKSIMENSILGGGVREGHFPNLILREGFKKKKKSMEISIL